MKRLALCIALGLTLGFLPAIGFAQPAGAKNIVCGWRKGADGYSYFACHIAGAHGAPNVVARIEDLTPTPEMVRLVARIVRGSAIDPRLVLAVIGAESAFDRQAVSQKHAVGLMQLMPETVSRFGVRDPFDAEENIRAGASYLLFLLRKYGNLNLALAAYNAGEGPVLSYGAVPPYEETMDYVARVRQLYARYQNIAFDRGEPAKALSTVAATKAKDIDRCNLLCRRGKLLGAQLDDISGRLLLSPSRPDDVSIGGR
jgi:hypothetical protein